MAEELDYQEEEDDDVYDRDFAQSLPAHFTLPVGGPVKQIQKYNNPHAQSIDQQNAAFLRK